MKTAILVWLGACGVPATADTVPLTEPANHAAKAEEPDRRFVDAIGAARTAYATWGRVDERPRAAPTDCAMPNGNPDGEASHVRISDAIDSPHDKKLYFLWATDRDGYLAQRTHDRPVPTGFTIVKESFHAEPSVAAAASAPSQDADFARAPRPIRRLRVGGTWFQTGSPEGLYVMTKISSKGDAGTDEGWIYGTIATDGTVTSAGRVASCMGCHERAHHERLFGLKPLPSP